MGGGTRNYKKKNQKAGPAPVSKLVQVGPAISNGGGGFGGGSASEGPSTNVCILNFEASFMTQVPEEDIQIGGEVYFVPRKQTGEFDLRLGSSLLGQYTGDNTETMWKCTAKGFEYVGRIVSAISGLGGTTVTCEVDTHRRET